MRKLVAAAGLLMLVPFALMAQDVPKAELYTGFSYLRLEKTNQMGWDSAIAGTINKNLAIVTDASGYYGSDSNTVNGITRKFDRSFHSVLVGPRVSDPRGRFTPFAQALFGWTREHVNQTFTSGTTPILSSNTSANAFGVSLGGGLDYNLNPSASLRILQVDYMMFNANNNKSIFNANSNKLQGVRLGGGVVFLLGKKK
jgi:opacity protein-like surface antigen